MNRTTGRVYTQTSIAEIARAGDFFPNQTAECYEIVEIFSLDYFSPDEIHLNFFIHVQ